MAGMDFLVVQRLRPHIPSAGVLGSIPGQGTRYHVLQMSSYGAAEDPACCSTKTWCDQIKKENKYFFLKERNGRNNQKQQVDLKLPTKTLSIAPHSQEHSSRPNSNLDTRGRNL